MTYKSKFPVFYFLLDKLFQIWYNKRKQNKKGFFKMYRLELLIIDVQNDFCHPNGSLFVSGADGDSKRLAAFINRMSERIYDIHCTLDTHHFLDIAHPSMWLDSNGKHPTPFTLIDEDSVVSGKFRTTNPAFMKRAIEYIRALKAQGRYILCVWPPHCMIGRWGHNVVDPVAEALLKWEEDCDGFVDYVTKGSNFFTEHYSAVQAEVVDGNDPSTMLNTGLIQTLEDADCIVITGQARSHCVANTVRDIANNFGDENIKKMVLLEDTTSDVTGFEGLGEAFVNEMTGRGMRIAKSTEFMV